MSRIERVKTWGKYTALGGGICTAVSSYMLYFTLIRLPDGASHDPLVEAIGPWIVISTLSILALLIGISLWLIALVAGAFKQ